MRVKCPLTGKLFIEPVTAEDGFTYENTAILKHFTKSHLSPVTFEEIGKHLMPSHVLRHIANHFRSTPSQEGVLFKEPKNMSEKTAKKRVKKSDEPMEKKSKKTDTIPKEKKVKNSDEPVEKKSKKTGTVPKRKRSTSRKTMFQWKRARRPRSRTLWKRSRFQKEETCQ